MTAPSGIILIEGADAAGKTTLARHLADRYGARYLHLGVHREIWRWHVAALRRAIRLAREQLVVIDRHWPSELCYGHVYRGGPAYDVGARCLDRALRRHGALTVLCAPADQARQAARWAAGRVAGKVEHFPRVREVIALYADLRDGNVARPGAGYLDQLVRFGDFAERDDVLVYDLDRHDPAALARRALARLAALRALAALGAGENLTGRAAADRPGWLLVGEAISPAWRAGWPRWPWADDDRRLSAATWLNRALHELAVREDRLELTNAVDPDDRLPGLLARSPLRVVCLGRVAAARVHELGHRGAAEVPHPQHHRRFHHGGGPAGYAKLLGEAMR